MLLNHGLTGETPETSNKVSGKNKGESNADAASSDEEFYDADD